MKHSMLSPDQPDQRQEAAPDGQKNLTNGPSLVSAPDHRKPLEDRALRASGQVGQVFTASHVQPRKTAQVSGASYETALGCHPVAPVDAAHRLCHASSRGALAHD
jgi:hypothetical protein